MKRLLCALVLLLALPVAAAPQSITSPGNTAGAPYLLVELTSGDFAVTANTPTKVPFNTVVVDTGGYYDNATNFRYTPLIAGKYLVTVSVRLSASTGASSPIVTQIRKNNVVTFASQLTQANTNGYGNTVTATGVVVMNGSTDFIEGFGQATGSAGTVFSSGATLTWMTIVYVGP